MSVMGRTDVSQSELAPAASTAGPDKGMTSESISGLFSTEPVVRSFASALGDDESASAAGSCVLAEGTAAMEPPAASLTAARAPAPAPSRVAASLLVRDSWAGTVDAGAAEAAVGSYEPAIPREARSRATPPGGGPTGGAGSTSRLSRARIATLSSTGSTPYVECAIADGATDGAAAVAPADGSTFVCARGGPTL